MSFQPRFLLSRSNLREATTSEEPMVFGWELPGPNVQDAAVLEEMMGAVLGASGFGGSRRPSRSG